jgi:phage gpG-like protein
MADRVVRVNDQDFKLKFSQFPRKVADGKTLLNVAWGVMQGSIARTFREEGYPAKSWAPLSPRTIAARRNKNKGSIKMLRDKGILFNSITKEPIENTGQRLVIGTNLVYAAIHQFGGLAGRKPPFKKDKDRNEKLGSSVDRAKKRYSTKSKSPKVRAKMARLLSLAVEKATARHAPGRRARIPARPYLVIRKEDPQRIVEGMEALMQKRINALGLGKGK